MTLAVLRARRRVLVPAHVALLLARQMCHTASAARPPSTFQSSVRPSRVRWPKAGDC